MAKSKPLTLKAFDRYNLNSLRADMDEALKVVADKYGIVIKAGNARFSPENATFKVELATKGEGGVVMNKDAKAYMTNAKWMGLKPEWLNKDFLFRGQKYTVIGLAPQSYKYPVICRRYDGKIFKLTRNGVRMGFGETADPRYA